jgi:hypothetical protein
MKIVFLPRPMDGTRYTKPSTKGPPLPLDICLKPFVQLNDGVSVVGPFKERDDAYNYMVELTEDLNSGLE